MLLHISLKLSTQATYSKLVETKIKEINFKPLKGNIMKATNKAATQLIIRQDAKGRPIAFVADSLAKGNMLAWKPSTKDAIVLPLSMYKTTKPIEDEQAVERIAKKYGRTFSTPNVQVRQRRGYDKERGNAPVYPLKKYASK